MPCPQDSGKGARPALCGAQVLTLQPAEESVSLEDRLGPQCADQDGLTAQEVVHGARVEHPIWGEGETYQLEGANALLRPTSDWGQFSHRSGLLRLLYTSVQPPPITRNSQPCGLVCFGLF